MENKVESLHFDHISAAAVAFPRKQTHTHTKKKEKGKTLLSLPKYFWTL